MPSLCHSKGSRRKRPYLWTYSSLSLSQSVCLVLVLCSSGGPADVDRRSEMLEICRGEGREITACFFSSGLDIAEPNPPSSSANPPLRFPSSSLFFFSFFLQPWLQQEICSLPSGMLPEYTISCTGNLVWKTKPERGRRKLGESP